MKIVSLLLLVLVLAALVVTPIASSQAEMSERAAWLVYWDVDRGLKEAIVQENEYDSLVHFAAFFNHDDSLFYPPELEELSDSLEIMLEGEPKKSYLSVVNDFTLADGSYSNKDIPLLKRLLQSGPERAGLLADDILDLALSRGYQGIEIDFEGILNDLHLWESFICFIEDLYAKSSALGLSIRVLLEPRTPFANLSFPQGPRYVMMCYNLFGYHSGPGPKASEDFLARMVEKMSPIPQEDRSFALALGGFDWAGGEAKQITVKAAQLLCKEYRASLKRHEEVASFEYTDEDGVLHEVWYSDELTLAYWTGVLHGLGERNVDLWKLGEMY